MPNNISNLSLSELKTHNFNYDDLVESSAQAKSLLGQAGRVSLDDAGHLTLVNPNAKPDNGFVRFFKGFFNPAYRAEQRILLRADVLAKNQTFNQSLVKSLILYSDIKANAGTFSQLDKISINHLATSAALRQTSDKLDLAHLKTLIKGTAANYHTLLSDAVKTGLENNGFKSDVFFRGQAVSALDFVTKLVPANNNIIIPEMKAAVGMAVIKNCAIHPDLMQGVLSKADGERLRDLLTGAKLTGYPKDELNALARKALSGFVDKLNAMTQQALARGCDPQAVSNLITEALRDISYDGIRNFDQQIFDPQSRDSYAHKLTLLPGGMAQAPMDPKVRADLDAVKQKVAGLDDNQAAKVAAFLKANSNITLDAYAEFVTCFRETGPAFIDLGKKPSYSNYSTFLDTFLTAVDRWEQVHPNGSLDTDDFINAGVVAGFHTLLVAGRDSMTSSVLQQCLDLRASFETVLVDPRCKDFKQVRDSERADLVSRSNFMGSLQAAFSNILDGTDGKLWGTPRRTSLVADLVMQARVQTPELQDLIRQSVSDVAPEYRKGMASYLEDALGQDIEINHRFAPTQVLAEAKQKVLSDPMFLLLLKEAQPPLSAEQEENCRAFLTHDLEFGLSSNLRQQLNHPAQFDAAGFHRNFDLDIVRGHLSKINGDPAGVDLEQVKTVFKQIVPKEFMPSVTALCQQSGLLAGLNAIICAPWNVQDRERYDIGTLLSMYNCKCSNEHASQIRREGDTLYLSAQLEQRLSSQIYDNAAPFGRFPLSIEVAIDLSAGVDEHGLPKSLVITELGRRTPNV